MNIRAQVATALRIGAVAAGLTIGATSLTAQVRSGTTDSDPLGRALAAEEKGERQVALVAYREVLQRAMAPGAVDGDRIAMALLGLERLWTETGARDSILPVVERVLVIRRSDPVARGIQLRQLIGMGRDADARAAFL